MKRWCRDRPPDAQQQLLQCEVGRIPRIIAAAVGDEVLDIAPVLPDDHQIGIEIVRPRRPRSHVRDVVHALIYLAWVDETQRRWVVFLAFAHQFRISLLLCTARTLIHNVPVLVDHNVLRRVVACVAVAVSPRRALT